MNSEAQKIQEQVRKHIREQIQAETKKLLSCAAMDDYKNVIEHAETLTSLVQRAKKIVEREER